MLSYHLADAVATDGKNDQHDPQNRNRNILTFYNTVRSAITRFYNTADTSQSLQNSECYRAICNELTFLANDTGTRRTLIIISDLMDKGEAINCYSENLTNPEKIAERLDVLHPMPKHLKGITVLFVFDPRNRTEDKEFGSMTEAYKLLLQRNEAKVIVQANL